MAAFARRAKPYDDQTEYRSSAREKIAHFVMDGDGNIVEWDEASEAIFGWTRDEALGARLSELIIPRASTLDA